MLNTTPKPLLVRKRKVLEGQASSSINRMLKTTFSSLRFNIGAYNLEGSKYYSCDISVCRNTDGFDYTITNVTQESICLKFSVSQDEDYFDLIAQNCESFNVKIECVRLTFKK